MPLGTSSPAKPDGRSRRSPAVQGSAAAATATPASPSALPHSAEAKGRIPMPQPAHEPAERLAYSVEEAAQVTGLSRDLLYDQMRAGKLAYLKVGRRRIITRQHLEAFLTQAAS